MPQLEREPLGHLGPVGTVSAGSQGKLALNLREAGSERACGARVNHNQLEREPLGHLGMSRGDGRCAYGRTLCLRLGGRFTEVERQKEPKPI